MNLLNKLLFLEDTEDIYYVSPTAKIVILVVIGLVLVAWLFVLFKFIIFRTLRVRFLLPNGKELEPIYLKKGAKINLPTNLPEIEGYKFKGFYIDEDLTEEYIDIPMPNQYMKLYAGYVNEQGEFKKFNN